MNDICLFCNNPLPQNGELLRGLVIKNCVKEGCPARYWIGKEHIEHIRYDNSIHCILISLESCGYQCSWTKINTEEDKPNCSWEIVGRPSLKIDVEFIKSLQIKLMKLKAFA